MPPRHLLVATKPFWDVDDIQGDPLYQQIKPILETAQPFPNTFNKAQQDDMDMQICIALKAQVPSYKCKTKIAPTN
jgi:hypothetical protein